MLTGALQAVNIWFTLAYPDIYTPYSSVNIYDFSDFLKKYNVFEDIMVSSSWFLK